jgi:hypothetical protein
MEPIAENLCYLAPAVITYTEPRRTALKARAAELSQGKTRCLNILDLPTETVSQIFRELPTVRELPELPGSPEPEVDKHAERQREKDRKESVGKLRLVCRRFHDLASPLLCPSVHFELTEASLRRVANLSNSPLGSGIRSVRVGLRYCPEIRLRHFAVTRTSQLVQKQQVLRLQSRRQPQPGLPPGSGSHIVDAPVVVETLERAVAHIDTVKSAWRSIVSGSSFDDRLPTVIEARYQAILTKGYEAFKRMHEEQYRLIEDGIFAERLACAMARMPRVTRLILSDHVWRHSFFDDYDPSYGEVLGEAALREFVSRPLTWAEIDHMQYPSRGPSRVLPVKLLWALPIALHRHGANLQHLELSCFPPSRGLSMLLPSSGVNNDDDSTAWRPLELAFQKLKTFIFLHRVGTSNISTADRAFPFTTPALPKHWGLIDEYISTALSGRALQRLSLNMLPYYRAHLKTTNDRSYLYDAGGLLARAQLPKLRHLSLYCVFLPQEVLEQCLTGLESNGNLHTLHLGEVHLRSGSWIPVLDLLREKVKVPAQTRADWEEEGGEPPVELRNLSGGEDTWNSVSGLISMETAHNMPYMQQAASYVMGIEGVRNPLVESGN